MSLKTSPMENQLTMKLKYICTLCVLQMANPLDKLVQGGWSTLSLTATIISCWGSLWGGVLQHIAHLGLQGHCWSSDGLECSCVCRAGQASQQLEGGCRYEPAVTALQQKQSVHCCGLKAPMNGSILKHLESCGAAEHIANHRAGTCCLLPSAAAEAGDGSGWPWEQRGDASLGEGKVFCVWLVP